MAGCGACVASDRGVVAGCVDCVRMVWARQEHCGSPRAFVSSAAAPCPPNVSPSSLSLCTSA
eukprot:scaffold202403_cov24-Tisochrysis_lutea.AAC.3